MSKQRHLLSILLIFFGFIIWLSIWQIRVANVNSTLPYYEAVPVYTLSTANSTYAYPIKSLPLSDYSRLMNVTDFKFTILNECNFSPSLLVVISSAPTNVNKRKAIRETWGTPRENVKVVFILGETANTTIQRQIEDENKRYKDFVQGTFLDAYRNMTYKHVMAFKYAIYHCPRAKFVLKTDDDVFVNMPMLMDVLMVDLFPNGARNLLACQINENIKVVRTIGSKWRVSFDEYKETYYPPYCPGFVVLYSPDVLFVLYEQAQKAEFFWIDGIFITGMIPKQQNIQHTNVAPLILSSHNMQEIFKKHSFNSIPTFLFGPPNISIKEIKLLWNFVKNHNLTKSVIKRYK